MRTRHVYPTREIAHLWAHKTQESARNQQGNFYFDGDTIYSYGRHFPIARHVDSVKGPAFLMTTDSYSPTTAKHISMVRRAIWQDTGNLPVFMVPNPELSPSNQVAVWDKRIKDTMEEVYGPTKRFRPKKWEALLRLIHDANEFTTHFGFKKRWSEPESTDAIKAAIKAEQERQERLNAKREREFRKREAEARKQAEERLTKWVSGESVQTYGLYNLPCRLRIKDDQVETSWGANFPVTHAPMAIRMVRAVMERGTPYKTNGHTLHLGHYRVDRIDTDGTVHAGCHQVAYSEVERIASLLGV